MSQKIRLIVFKVCLLGLATLGTIEILYRFNPYAKKESELNYTASIEEKYKRLQALPSPKIVLIAGSNFAYGINSEMIEQSFHKPVVNMAMHYAYGSDFMLRQIESELHKGDMVVMGFEYIVESKGVIGDKILMARMFPKANRWFEYENGVQFLKENATARISNMRLIIDRIINTDKMPTVEDTTSVFFRRAINKYGDLVSHLNNPSFKTLPSALLSRQTSMLPVIADMNTFYEKMKKKGVKVYYTFPSYAKSGYEENREVINKIDTEFRQNAKFPILGNFEDFIFADSLGHDMVYHLNAKGRNIRTQKLIDLLKNEN